MGDILKEAIADAKAVRETALENAKIALEEAFAPRIQSMLSAKLKEIDDEGSEEEVDEISKMYRDEDDGEEVDEMSKMARDDEDGEDVDEISKMYRDDDAAEDDLAVDLSKASDEEGMGDKMGDDEDEAVPADEGVIEINGVKYAPVVQEDEVFESEEVSESDSDITEEDNLDLESVIKELESELEESDNPYDGNEQHGDYKEASGGGVEKKAFSEGEEEDKEKDEVDESAAGEDQTAGDFDPTGAKRKSVDAPSQGNLKTENADDEIVEIELDEESDEIDETLDSSGIGKGDNHGSDQYSADTEDPQGSGVKKEKFSESSVEKMATELKEYKEAVVFLKDRLHEVNILNAKLLFTNKLFKEFVLDNGQKMKIVETFDRAQTVREIKLVYSTLAESFKGNSKVTTKQSIKESVAGGSKPVSSTKPKTKKIITEEQEVANRFKKLAGLL